MKKTLLAYFKEFQTPMLFKDTFLIPYYLSKKLNLNLEIFATENQSGAELPSFHRGVSIRVTGTSKANNIKMLKTFVLAWWTSIYKTNYCFFVGCRISQLIFIMFMRLIKPSMKFIIMGDYEPDLAKEILETGFWTECNGIKGKLKKLLLRITLKPSILCIAQKRSFEMVKLLYDKWGWRNIVYMYPCLDDDFLYKTGIIVRDPDDKENIFLYVGRIGNYQKNTDMLLEALDKVDLKDWRFYIIGQVTDSFRTDSQSSYQNKIDEFFEKHPHLVEKVIFTGPIYDTKTIFEYYNKAKVFVLTSRHESFANVLSEAAAFGCFFVSTDVGGASLVTNSWRYGIKIDQEDSDGLAIAINSIISGSIKINKLNRFPVNELLYSNKIVDIVRFLK